MSRKSSFSRTGGDVCCQLVRVSICLFDTEVVSGLFKGVTGVPVIPVHKHDQKQGQFAFYWVKYFDLVDKMGSLCRVCLLSSR